MLNPISTLSPNMIMGNPKVNYMMNPIGNSVMNPFMNPLTNPLINPSGRQFNGTPNMFFNPFGNSHNYGTHFTKN